MNKNFRICLLGKPGSGKGTLSSLLTKQLPVEYYNVGQILRDKAHQDKHIYKVHAEGGLVDSTKVLNIFDDALQNNNFILDGSPRKPFEAKYILNHPKWKSNPGIVIYLKISDDEVIERLSKRNRFDDTVELLQKRLDHFNQTTLQSIELFREQDCILEIDASKDPSLLVEKILKGI